MTNFNATVYSSGLCDINGEHCFYIPHICLSIMYNAKYCICVVCKGKLYVTLEIEGI